MAGALLLAATVAAVVLWRGAGGEDTPVTSAAVAPERFPAASAESVARSVEVSGLVEHLRALEQIADGAGGTRAAGGAGDRQSERYVVRRLRAAGWRVRLQPLSFPYSAQRTPPRLEAAGRAIETTALRFSGSGSVKASLALAGSGCLPGDYAGFPRGSVALVRRGDCFLRQIVLAAERAGAAGAVIYDPAGAGPPLPGTLISPGPRIPAVSVRRADGRRLATDLPPVRLRVNAVSEMRRTRNVIAELGSGPGVAMAGAHLDSVPEGPGVNDDGSGVAALLELAEQLGASKARVPRRVRLAFWGAEEQGLYGSRRYVRGLPAGERKRIAGYLNLDMIGSGNGGRLIYGGTRGAAARAAAAVRRLFRSRGVRVEVTHPGADSDHAPFEAAGIPILGLSSGASEIKGSSERAAWGGRAGRPYDSCYHLACDRLARMDMRTLSELSDGAAVAVFELAHP
jgi:Iap family predicted aminopeptidase